MKTFFTILSALLLSHNSNALAQLPPIMHPPMGNYSIWTCYGMFAEGQYEICGQYPGYDDYLARRQCSSHYQAIMCYPTY